MPFLYCFKGSSHAESLIFFLYFLFPISALFSDTPLRILQINSLHLKYWDLDDWTSRSGSVVQENLQSHRLSYPWTGDPAPPGLQHSYLQNNNSNTTESLGLCSCGHTSFPKPSTFLHDSAFTHRLDLLISSAWYIGCRSVKEVSPGKARCKAQCLTACSPCHGDMPFFCQVICCDTSPILWLVAWCG